MIIPEEIRKNVLSMKDKNGSLNIRSYKKNVSKETFNFLQEYNITITELFNLIKYDFSEFPKCPTCGSPVRNFYKNHTYCSNKCAQRSIEIKDKIKKTNLERFGVEYSSQNKEIRDKQKKTCLEKYGTEYTFQSKEIQDKVKATNLERYGTEYYTNTNEFKEKVKHTNVEKYGVENVWSSEEIKDKIKKTMLERYGAENYRSSKESTIRCRTNNYQIFKDRLKLKMIELLTPLEEYIFAKNLKFKCLKCNTEFTSTKRNIHKIHCPNYAIEMSSAEEKELYYYIKSIYNNEIIQNSRKIITPYEIDIYIPEKNLAIEYNGSYWHSDLYHEILYHQKKYLLCKNKNIKLIQVTDYHWINKNAIVKSIIKSNLNIFDKIVNSNDCSIEEINQDAYSKFLVHNHIEGPIISDYRLGLLYQNELISVIGFSKKSSFIHIDRFCNKINCNIIGSFKKFLDYSKFDEFVLHCNLNYFNEHDYKYNINESSIEKPNYFYWNFIDYIIDTNEIKFKIKYDESKTEYENMISNGYYRIYDAGNLKLIYKK